MAGVFITEYFTATKDSSWIVEVEDFIKKENQEPESEYNPIADYSFYLSENGESHYFVLESQNEFISYIDNLMNRINRLVEKSISDELLDEILETNRILSIFTRLDKWKVTQTNVMFMESNSAFLILEDKLGKGLEGTIIVLEPLNEEPYRRYNVWQINKSSIW